MEEKVFEDLTYLVYYPEDFQPNKKYPLVIFLHGAGSRGETADRLKRNFCLSCIRKHQVGRNFIILAPHCKGVTWGEWMTPLLHLVEQFREQPFVDQTRIHLTGNSMGGFGTWALATLRPDWFASAMPVAGGGNGFARRLVDLPIRVYHGLCDTIVDPVLSFQAAQAVNKAGGHAELFFFPNHDHDIWEDVYDNDENYDWMLSFTNVREKTPLNPQTGKYFG